MGNQSLFHILTLSSAKTKCLSHASAPATNCRCTKTMSVSYTGSPILLLTNSLIYVGVWHQKTLVSADIYISYHDYQNHAWNLKEKATSTPCEILLNLQFSPPTHPQRPPESRTSMISSKYELPS